MWYVVLISFGLEYTVQSLIFWNLKPSQACFQLLKKLLWAAAEMSWEVGHYSVFPGMESDRGEGWPDQTTRRWMIQLLKVESIKMEIWVSEKNKNLRFWIFFKGLINILAFRCRKSFQRLHQCIRKLLKLIRNWKLRDVSNHWSILVRDTNSVLFAQ